MTESKIPILKPDQLIRALEKLGFSRTRKSRSGYLRYCHPDGRRTTVPAHKGKTISRGLLRKIIRDVDISFEELKDLL
ncbi:MAG: type II toxin-antitoxin system HicA family toxin [Gemmatimonadota bacterium]|nr:MAG: type II toxin-antitoxin system HicA family toxin [Gemmatimonadota bacterium]